MVAIALLLPAISITRSPAALATRRSAAGKQGGPAAAVAA